MNKKIQPASGGAAFPRLNMDPWGKLHSANFGLTVLDYFAAHAPAEPQPWFKPVMPARPEPQWGDEDGNKYESRKAAEDAVGDELTTVLNREEVDAWDEEYKKQRLVQWPYAWASHQLALRQHWERVNEMIDKAAAQST